MVVQERVHGGDDDDSAFMYDDDALFVLVKREKDQRW
jgi:hypothetical protein